MLHVAVRLLLVDRQVGFASYSIFRKNKIKKREKEKGFLTPLCFVTGHSTLSHTYCTDERVEDVARQKLREGGRKSGKGGRSTKTLLSAIRDRLKTKVRRTEKKVKFQDKWC